MREDTPTRTVPIFLTQITLKDTLACIRHWHILDSNVRHVTLNMFGCYTTFTFEINLFLN